MSKRRPEMKVVFPKPDPVADDDPALLAFVKDLAVYCADKYLAGQLPKRGPDWHLKRRMRINLLGRKAASADGSAGSAPR